MIVEQRTYLFHPGGVPRFMQFYTPQIQQMQRDILGNLIGYFTAETGIQNQTVHLWGYDSFEGRLRRRAELAGKEEWRGFLANILPLLVSQESKILLPTAFSPIR